jgi:hypothetical protein
MKDRYLIVALAVTASLMWMGVWRAEAALAKARQLRERYVVQKQAICGATKDSLALCWELMPDATVTWLVSREAGIFSEGDILRECEPTVFFVEAKDGSQIPGVELRCEKGVRVRIRGYLYGGQR